MRGYHTILPEALATGAVRGPDPDCARSTDQNTWVLEEYVSLYLFLNKGICFSFHLTSDVCIVDFLPPPPREPLGQSNTVHHSIILLSMDGNLTRIMPLVPYLLLCCRAATAACWSFLSLSLAWSMSVLCTGLFSNPLTSASSRCQEQGTQRVR